MPPTSLLTAPPAKIPLGVGLVGHGGVITLIAADIGTAWVLVFKTPGHELHVLAAGEDDRRRRAPRPALRVAVDNPAARPAGVPRLPA